ncbi:hypothetical protein [Cupriavidus metallidurans]|uniref:hypothetical protein n=1 Tax=Cupriavidus metallidurans TaxID=119219 RepID=UPI001E401BF7|nr:hypothetical protein [Cupriavidus metallidurans]
MAVYVLGRLDFRLALLLILGVFVAGALFRQQLFSEFQSIFPVLATYLNAEVSRTIVPLPFMFNMVPMGFAVYLWRQNDVCM